MFATIIPRNVRLSEAPSYGVPIHLYDAQCSGAQAYRTLAKELIRRNEGMKMAKKVQRGLGRGLGALLGDDVESGGRAAAGGADRGGRGAHAARSDLIDPNREQPRRSL